MKIAIVQPNYIPWVGYFELINSVDTFVFLDDVQYTKRDWRNRNKIQINGNEIWLTIPIKKHAFDSKICDIEVVNHNWIDRHMKTIQMAYPKKPGKEFIIDMYNQLLDKKFIFLNDINVWIIEKISDYLNIRTNFFRSSQLNLNYKEKNLKLIEIIKYFNCDEYFSGPKAEAYLNPVIFKQNGVSLHIMDYNKMNSNFANNNSDKKFSVVDQIINLSTNSSKFTS